MTNTRSFSDTIKADLEQHRDFRRALDLSPFSQPFITRDSGLGFGEGVVSLPPSWLCKCGKRLLLSTFA
jgi:hypothetical protein